MYCKSCGAKVDNGTEVCPNCGAKLGEQKPDDTIFCSNCGQKISKEALICPHCGVGTEKYRRDQEKATHTAAQPAINIVNTNTATGGNAHGGYGYIHKKKWVAFFLCLFLGYFGIHRFYVGKAGTGILWLFSGGLFGLGWFIDLLMILFGGFRDKAGQPLM